MHQYFSFNNLSLPLALSLFHLLSLRMCLISNSGSLDTISTSVSVRDPRFLRGLAYFFMVACTALSFSDYYCFYLVKVPLLFRNFLCRFTFYYINYNFFRLIMNDDLVVELAELVAFNKAVDTNFIDLRVSESYISLLINVCRYFF